VRECGVGGSGAGVGGCSRIFPLGYYPRVALTGKVTERGKVIHPSKTGLRVRGGGGTCQMTSFRAKMCSNYDEGNFISRN